MEEQIKKFISKKCKNYNTDVIGKSPSELGVSSSTNLNKIWEDGIKFGVMSTLEELCEVLGIPSPIINWMGYDNTCVYTEEGDNINYYSDDD